MAKYHSKMVRKSMYWSKHGRHKGMLAISMYWNAQLKKPSRPASMYASVDELMDAECGKKRSAKKRAKRPRRRKDRRGQLVR